MERRLARIEKLIRSGRGNRIKSEVTQEKKDQDEMGKHFLKNGIENFTSIF